MPLPLSGVPHLFDMILEAAPRESLLAMRGVCHAFRERVDALMFNHIVVFYSSSSRCHLFIHGPDGERLPRAMEWNCPQLPHPARGEWIGSGEEEELQFGGCGECAYCLGGWVHAVGTEGYFLKVCC